MIGAPFVFTMLSPRPNFFIIGAPKCGTTSLYDWLSGHPQIFFPVVKEPHFFALLRRDRTVESLDDYLALYRGATDKVAIGDGSTTYLHTPAALEAVRAFAPDARIIVVVRNPINLIRSLHAYKLGRQQEDVSDFEQAWKLSDARRRGESLPPNLPDRYQVVYADMGLIGQRCRHVVEVFPPDQVHFVLFDDLVKDPKAVYEGILDHLNLKQDGRVVFEASNVTGEQGSGLVYKVAAMLPKPLKNALRKAGVGSSKIAGKTSTTSAGSKAKPPVSDEFLQHLRDYYRADIELLGQTLNRDLSHWLTPKT